MMRVPLCTLIFAALLHAGTSEAPQHRAILADSLIDSTSAASKATRIVLAMTDGLYSVEHEPGPFLGPNWTGTFELQLLDDRRQIVSTARLNESFEELRFQKPFSFQFSDYNQDGHPDFAIGQYASSNVYIYRLFTIIDDKIKELPIVPDQEIISSERGYSILFTKGSHASFETVYYNNAAGTSFKRVYEWNGNAFERVLETSSQK
ncbi:hypothetical protein [Brevibacillus panacihumi]|uniref:VCBS repeat-containing protein n=1 Tax=Brevibacillus panacihumi TaxID=497735 RepID=A0A3M8CZP1_9BACL|nr:hypothetical protein [Brevibacillus panacihumi]RNB80781.1 hypothetical protein EDM58_08020 [Brevibacillus panacihumi]